MLQDLHGPYASFAQIVSFILTCLMLAVFIYFLMDVSQPYVKIINYKYKSNYYKPFVLPEGYDIETQGRKWSQWDDDTPESLIANDGISKMCKLFNESAGWANDHPRSKNAALLIKLWEDFIAAFLVKLESTNVEDPNFQGFPWGHNWYEFSITIPTNFAYYIVHKLNSRATNKWAARSIQLLIKDPEHSLGYQRDKANSAMMVFPWTLSHMITGTLDITNPSYKYAIQQYDVKPNPNLHCNEDGVHIDYAYLTHGGVYAYGYLWSIENIYPDTEQIIPEVKHFNIRYHMDRIYAIFKHKTVPFSGCCLWKRDPTIASPLYTGNRETPLCMVIPTMRYIRIFGENYQFSAKSGQATVAYYENDHKSHRMGLYSCFCRKVFTRHDTDVVTHNTPGFVLPVGANELTDTPTTSITTTKFMCTTNTEIGRKYNGTFVYADEKWGLLYQNHVEYPPLIVPDDKLRFDETILIDIEHERLYVYILTWQGHFVDYIINENTRHTTTNTTNQIYYEVDLKTQTYENIQYAAKDNIETAIKNDIKDLTGYLSFDPVLTGADLLENKAFVVYNYLTDTPLTYCPRETEIASEVKIIPWKNKDHTFKFDEISNQYVNTAVRFGTRYSNNIIKYKSPIV